MELESVMETTITNLLASLPGIISGFAAAGPAGWIAGGALLLVVLVGGFFLRGWITAKLNAAAQAKTEADRVTDRTDAGSENGQISDASSSAEADAREAAKTPKPK